jgi:deoxyribonuclease IV
MTIKFGPAGLGGIKEAIYNLEKYSKLGLKACEIAFTYGIYIKEKDVPKIRETAEKLGISLSIHAPYYINLNSEDKEKVEKSKQRILDCCKIGTLLGAKKIVFHPGYYNNSKKETYNKIKKEIIELQKEIKKNNYTPKLAPEITGKINVFGSIDEISQLVRDTKCSFCIDFAHILARYKDYKFEDIKKNFDKYKKWHLHFSGIEYNEKGEKRHKLTKKQEWKKLLKNIPKTKEIIIINESPNPIEDSLKGLKIYKNIT